LIFHSGKAEWNEAQPEAVKTPTDAAA